MSTKIWLGTDSGNEGDPTVADNWLPISIQNSTYKWTASGSGIDEYYCELQAGGDPGLEEPANVQENASNMSAGTAGSLATGEWDWADNDTLGYSTVYVRLSDGADPDSKAIDYVTFTNTPQNDDDVYLQDSSQSIDTNLDQSSILLTSLNIAQSYTGSIGDNDNYWQIAASTVNVGYHTGPGNPSGSSLIKLDLGSTQTAITIYNTGAASATTSPLQILNSHASSTLEIRKGRAAIATGTGETSQFATITPSFTTSKTGDTYLYFGSGLILATLTIRAGNVIMNCGATAVTLDDGNLRTEGSGAIATYTQDGGAAILNSSGTMGGTGGVTINGGTADWTKSSASRTVTNLKPNGGTIKIDPAPLTITWAAPDEPISMNISAA